jgi:glycerophosphoryl diester phosphodiesterase
MYTTPKIIAHRGDSSSAPENTLSSIRKALALHVDYIEIDVRLSKDGIPVVVHDETLIRTGRIHHGEQSSISDGSDPFIHEMTLNEIKRFDVGRWFHDSFIGEPVPTLEEVLQEDWQKTGLMIEIKECDQSPTLIVEAIFKVLNRMSFLPSNLMIGSFCLQTITEIKKRLTPLDPIARVIGIAEDLEMIPHFLQNDVKCFALCQSILSPELVSELNEQDVDVWTFTVDDHHFAQKLVSYGVSGIISNTPSKHKT